MITLPSSEYSVGWICALPLELTAARAMLDIEHGKPADQDPNDSNTYCLGSIGSYNIVIACLPVGAYGLVSTAVVGTKMLQTFKSLEYGLMVGIGGGVPSEEVDVRLGDVVVSKPGKGSGGVIQFDFGKEYGNGLFERVGSLNRPPEALLTALAFLETDYLIRGNRIPDLLDTAYARFPTLVPHFRYQGHATDLLFAADYDHLDTKLSCEKCKCAKLVARPLRTDSCPRVFQGLIASGNQVMKHAPTRDRLGNELGVICFEMEAAALMNILPSLVIRGICDYADSHKSKRWQPYAAMTAAAFASDLIRVLPKKSEQVALRTLEMPHANESECPSFPARAQNRHQHTDCFARLGDSPENIHGIDCLSSLLFDNMRYDRITESHADSLEWFWTHRQYTTWSTSTGSRLLYVEGKPGSGKITEMGSGKGAIRTCFEPFFGTY
ncbi:nucleoside phosphorylase domain-containing protein [Aspergillus californicus]